MLRHGRLLAMPEGLQLVIPKRLWPFVKSPLFSWPGKLRMGLDLVLPKRSARGDESVASFMCRRLGQEALDLLAEPILSGIFSADPERQSLLATFPQLMDLERKHRSLILGALRTPPPPGPRPPSMFLSFRRGMQTLTDALASSLGENLLLNRAVKSIQRDSHGFIVGLGDSALTARRIILTASAKQSASLLTTVAPKAASLLAQMRYTSSGCAFLAYPKVNVKHSLEGYGILIPKVEKRMINAVTWVSSKIEGRAPASHALFRVFFGGERCPEMMERSDEEIVAIAQREVAELHGITGEPTLTRVFRSQQGNPQYDVGHLDRVKQIEGDLPPGLVVTGCGMRGVGIPDCIRQAKASI
jgi:oxygen-dependent protoporphyrinogen oxidase